MSQARTPNLVLTHLFCKFQSLIVSEFLFLLNPDDRCFMNVLLWDITDATRKVHQKMVHPQKCTDEMFQASKLQVA